MLLDGRKVAGILAEGRPQEGWAVLGIGVNVAVRVEDLPPSCTRRPPRSGASTSGVEPFLARCSPRSSARWRCRASCSTHGAPATRCSAAHHWSGGAGTAAGIDGEGRLVVELADGGRTALDAGEVHLQR